MYTCPKCGKQFARANQSHVCSKATADAVLANKPDTVVTLYNNLLQKLQRQFNLTVTFSPKAITLYGTGKKSFLVIEPKKAWIDVWFTLHRKYEEPPVFKILQPSKHRFAHFVRLESEMDIDRHLIKLVKEAYSLSND